jgi:hypothetical protein
MRSERARAKAASAELAEIGELQAAIDEHLMLEIARILVGIAHVAAGPTEIEEFDRLGKRAGIVAAIALFEPGGGIGLRRLQPIE